MIMAALSIETVGYFCLLSRFVYYQQYHLKHFRGASDGFLTLLTYSAALGMISEYGFLLYYGWSVVWWAPVVLFLLDFAFGFPFMLIEKTVSATTISLAGFVGWPVCAYLLFRSIAHLATGSYP